MVRPIASLEGQSDAALDTSMGDHNVPLSDDATFQRLDFVRPPFLFDEVCEDGAQRPENVDQYVSRRLVLPGSRNLSWDYNWDGRETERTSYEALATTEGFGTAKKSGKVRHILMIRHGQYEEGSPEDELRVLTPLGRRQADLTGQRLASIIKNCTNSVAVEINSISVSDMTRAKETASIIASHLPGMTICDPDPLLNEGIPSRTVPVRPELSYSDEYVASDQARIEQAFKKYIHRAEPEKQQGSENATDEVHHEIDVIVGHGNVIRYFFCRSLQLPREAWLRLSVFNCSITYLVIPPNGYAVARTVGDIGHLPYEETTFSGNHGFLW